eukprot:1995617-Rhodomonas_salina.3
MSDVRVTANSFNCEQSTRRQRAELLTACWREEDHGHGINYVFVRERRWRRGAPACRCHGPDE